MDRYYGTPIRLIREEFGLSQNKAALLMGLAQSTLSRIEDGSRWPTRPMLAQIGLGLNISPRVFFYFVSRYTLSLPESVWRNVSWEDFLKDGEDDE